MKGISAKSVSENPHETRRCYAYGSHLLLIKTIMDSESEEEKEQEED